MALVGVVSIRPRLRLGTRGSRLALAQAHSVKAQLNSFHPDLEVEIVTIKTSGDKGDRDRLGAFVREIQDALLRNEIDLALHCLKDLPTEPVQGLTSAAHLEREDPRDALIGFVGAVQDLPEEAVVGTGSVRRTSQLAAIRPDLSFKPLVGNVDTRLRKLMEGEYDAIILAIAGLKRLGVLESWADSEYHALKVSPLPTEIMLPAPGQAVLVLESRRDDSRALDAARPLNHAPTEASALAERTFLQAFGGGCSVPIAALGRSEDDLILLEGLVAAPDGSRVLRGTATGPAGQPSELAKGLADRVIAQGALNLFQRTPVLQGGTEH